MAKGRQSGPAPAPVAPAPAEAARPLQYRIKLIRPAGEDAQAKTVQVNGNNYTVTYDLPEGTVVPAAVYEALKDARTAGVRKNADGYDEHVDMPRFTVVVLGTE